MSPVKESIQAKSAVKVQRIALAGNPNSGKTTLFNQLTGSTAHVGNWPGVTVERKEGRCKRAGNDLTVVDLPGIYSLAPYSPEEVVARNYIVNERPDLVINIVDATNLERNLYLTTQLLETDTPLIIALNMTDVLEKNGDSVDIDGLSRKLGVPVIPISAARNKGIDELLQMAAATAPTGRRGASVLAESYLGESIEKLAALLEANNIANSVYHAVKLVEGDREATGALKLGAVRGEADEICAQAKRLCPEGDCEAATADLRYQYITRHCSPLHKRQISTGALTSSDKADKIITNRVLGIPIFILMMFLVFHLTFTENLLFFTELPGPGAWLAGVVEGLVEMATEGMAGLLESIGASEWAVGLVIDGIFAGVGAVLGFLPLVLVLYLFISILEDSGYMARAAFIMDRLLRKFGLSGKSFVPLIMGFGCSVPAISATRTLENERDRKMTIMLIPFMSCGAKLPIYALIVPIFFAGYAEFVVTGIYVLGIIVAIIAGIIMKNTAFKGEVAPFIMELPPYRMPSLKSLGIHLWEKFKGFATKVGTIITVSTIIIWFLANFGFDGGFGMVDSNSANSILGYIGNALRFIFVPLGFAGGADGWRAVVAVLTGLIAKEAVVSTMGQLYTGLESDALEDESAATALAAVIASTFSVPAALSFIAWNLFSTPCMAAVGAIAQEMNSRKWFWITMAFHIGVAWIVSFIVYWAGVLVQTML